MNYIWGGPGLYPNLVRSLQTLGQPVRTAAQLLQLGAQSGERAKAIHHDPALTVDQKRAALVTLQDSVRPELDALVPAAQRALLPERGTAWFSGLAEGSYRQFWPTLLSSGLTEVAPVSVTNEPAGRPGNSALPRRTPGG